MSNVVPFRPSPTTAHAPSADEVRAACARLIEAKMRGEPHADLERAYHAMVERAYPEERARFREIPDPTPSPLEEALRGLLKRAGETLVARAATYVR